MTSELVQMPAFDEKIDLLDTFLKLEELDSDLFRSTHQLRGRRAHNRVYGGQVVGQALMAASKTVEPELVAHSLHCYFIQEADADRPILYQVQRVRDGRSFATRLVKARQNGKNVCTCSVSYQKIEPDSISHQQAIPDVPPPEECEDARDFLIRLLDNPHSVSEEGKRAAEAYSKVLDIPSTFQVRLVTPRKYIQVPLDKPMKFACWVKTNTEIGSEANIQNCIAAFISDVAPVGTPVAAHAGAGFKLGMAASLDHAMWFHRPGFRMDNNWVLYETESTCAAGGRALIHGKMWTRNGKMVLSTAQEILVRAQREEKKE